MIEASISDCARLRCAIAVAGSPEDLERVPMTCSAQRNAGQIRQRMGKVAPVSSAGGRQAGSLVKQEIEAALEAKRASSPTRSCGERLDAEWIDLTLPAPGVRPGSLHPVTRVQAEIEDTFVSMGFTVLDVPEVESEYNNFDALNIPAIIRRDAQDTFWLTDGNLLRTHTSPVQIRGMEKLRPPFRMIAPGRAFRNEAWTPRDGPYLLPARRHGGGSEVSVANLIYFMKRCWRRFFIARWRALAAGFFPFVEPGFELDINA